MWVWLLFAITISTVYAQFENDKISRADVGFGWNWQLSTAGAAGTSLENYEIVKFPQTISVYEIAPANMTQIQTPPLSTQPVNFYLQQPTSYIQPGPAAVSNYNTDTYIPYGQFNDQLKEAENSKPLSQEGSNEYRSPVQVFKDHNCTEHISKDLETDINKSKALFAEVPFHDWHDINNFATSLPQPYTYKGAVNFKVETPRPNSRNERFYYTTIQTPLYEQNTTLDGIDKLVASTQDLVSNDDLVFINHAAEKHIHEQSEEIKPRSRYNKKSDSEGKDIRKHIIVKAKIGNIREADNDRQKQTSQSNSNKYDFATPIVVSETSYNNFREQVVDNLVSTMVPYIEHGYQIVGVRDTIQENQRNSNNKNEIVNVTPRPINQNYLAPITVALRLINSNDSELFNTVDDHEAADSEFITDTVKSPSKEKTTVEVQKSIPVSITHINDVEVHEYLDIDEGRSNDKGPLDVAKSLYNKYIDALKTSEKVQENMRKLRYQYTTSKEEDDKKDQDNDSDQLEYSENTQSLVKINLNKDDSNNQRSEHVQYYDDYDNQKIIQPIIIEKEVPVTKFVDRFIEKKVPYPQHVEVKVPVDRPVPVAVPVEKIVEKPVEVTRYVDKPYPVEVPRPYPVEVKVPYPVEQKVFVDRPIHVPYPVEKVVEKQVIHPVAVPTPVGFPIEVPYPVEHKVLYPVAVDRPVPVQVDRPVEKIVHRDVPVPYAVEKKVPYPVHYETRVPVPYPVEKRIPVPVERIVEKPVTITKYIEKPVHIQVPVPQPVAVPVQVPQPYPVDRIVEKKVPYPVHIDRIVEKPVNVPYPVEKIVEKIVEKPVYVTKYVDKPYPVETKVPYPVEKIVEKKVPYAVHVPYEVKVPYPVEKIVNRPVHIPVPYAYSHSEISSESRHNPQYQKQPNKEKREEIENQKKKQQQLNYSQYYQLLKEKEKLKQSAENSLPVLTTHWGNQYASSYQYINNTSENKRDENKLKNLANYISYVTNANAQDKSNGYYGPVPPENQDDWWQNNKNYVVEVKMRRADREPKFSNLRIEYGGFKPPLIPSTEVDLDGMPINKET